MIKKIDKKYLIKTYEETEKIGPYLAIPLVATWQVPHILDTDSAI